MDKRWLAPAGVLLVAAVLAPAGGPSGIVWTAVLLSWLPLVAVFRWPPPAFGLSLAAGVVAAVAFPDPAAAWAQVAVQDLAVLAVAATRRRRVSVPAAVGALVVQVVVTYVDRADAAVGLVGVLLLAVVAAWTVGWSLRQRQERQQLRRDRALADERLRIARDVHDLVAHSIGVIALQAGMGRRVIDTQPAEARAALATIERTSRETLAGLRRTVTALRDAGPAVDPAPGLADVPALAAVGVRLDVRRTGDPRPLPPDLEWGAYRVIQEAVTNVARHSGADAATVTLDHGPDALTVEVVDGGRGGVAGLDGFGLAGMRERVAAFGGSVTAGPRPEGGWRVAARLPLP